MSDTDNMDEKVEAVTLITLHQAKGLEFPVVFMVGMEEGLLPHVRSMNDDAEMEEERRLCYVGVTRAKERLYLARAYRRGFRGGFEPNEPSRFLSDIPKELIVTPPSSRIGAIGAGAWSPTLGRDVPSRPLERIVSGTKMPADGAGSAAERSRMPKSREPAAPVKAFATGDIVRHAKFGEGIVTGTKPATGRRGGDGGLQGRPGRQASAAQLRPAGEGRVGGIPFPSLSGGPGAPPKRQPGASAPL